MNNNNPISDQISGPAGVRDAVAEIEKQQILAVAEVAFDDPDVIALWYGESDLTTPSFIREEAMRALGAGDTFYTLKRGIPDLLDAIAAYTSNVYDIPMEADRVTLASSGMTAIMLALQSILNAGENVIIVSPVWPNAQSAVRVLGDEPRYVTLENDGSGFALDLEKIYAATDEKTRAVFVNSPNNPSGWVMPSEQQAELMEFCRSKGIWIIADEVYARMVYDGKAAPSFLTVSRPDDPLLVINSFSKSWAMTGWRMGWITHPASMGDLIGNLIEFNYSCVPPFLQPAAAKALREGEGFVAEMVDYCRQARDIVSQRLPSIPGIKGYQPPAASFYAFFQVDGVTDTLGFAQDLARNGKVGIAPGTAFGPGAEGWFRMCFAQKPERILTAMDRLESFLQNR